MTLNEVIQYAAGHLPDGWQIHLWVERGAAWIDLYDDLGDQVNFDSCPDKDLAEQVSDAITEALSCD